MGFETPEQHQHPYSFLLPFHRNFFHVDRIFLQVPDFSLFTTGFFSISHSSALERFLLFCGLYASTAPTKLCLSEIAGVVTWKASKSHLQIQTRFFLHYSCCVAEQHIMDEIPDFSPIVPHFSPKNWNHLVDTLRRPEFPSAYVELPPCPDDADLVEPFFDVEACHTHTQASFNTIRYKGRDSASGIDRKLSIIRPGATTIVAP
jgi:hypothetical protein